MSDNLIITVKEARKILGKKYANESDDYIQDVILQLSSISTAIIRNGSRIH